MWNDLNFFIFVNLNFVYIFFIILYIQGRIQRWTGIAMARVGFKYFVPVGTVFFLLRPCTLLPLWKERKLLRQENVKIMERKSNFFPFCFWRKSITHTKFCAPEILHSRTGSTAPSHSSYKTFYGSPKNISRKTKHS